MRPIISEIKYFETYYFTNIINNILNDPSNFLRSLNDFFGDQNYRNFLAPFPRTSRLHDFIIFIVDALNDEDTLEYNNTGFLNGKRKLWVELALEHYDFKFDHFKEYLHQKGKVISETDEDDISDYFMCLRLYGPYEELLERISEEIFFILFLNRKALQNFNLLISHQVEDRSLEELYVDDLPYFRKNGVLRRKNIPKWVQRAVTHRDRGMCVSCHKNLSGQLSIGEIENFDHIIPLAKGGINDVTNIQLLCEKCNKTKQSKNISTSIKYEKWY